MGGGRLQEVVAHGGSAVYWPSGFSLSFYFLKNRTITITRFCYFFLLSLSSSVSPFFSFFLFLPIWHSLA